MTSKQTLFIFFSIVVLQLQSQDFYMTKKGNLKMVSKINDQIVTLESNKLELYLDYTSKEMTGTLDLRSLNYNIPELNKYIKDSDQPLLVHFSGIIPAEDFMAQAHQALNFNWQVNITFQDNIYKVILESVLEHASQGYLFSCRLNTFGEFNSNIFGLKKLIPNLDDTIGIQIVQTVLRDY